LNQPATLPSAGCLRWSRHGADVSASGGTIRRSIAWQSRILWGTRRESWSVSALRWSPGPISRRAQAHSRTP